MVRNFSWLIAYGNTEEELVLKQPFRHQKIFENGSSRLLIRFFAELGLIVPPSRTKPTSTFRWS